MSFTVPLLSAWALGGGIWMCGGLEWLLLDRLFYLWPASRPAAESLRVPKLLSAEETDSLSVSAGATPLSAMTPRIQLSPDRAFLSPSPWACTSVPPLTSTNKHTHVHTESPLRPCYPHLSFYVNVFLCPFPVQHASGPHCCFPSAPLTASLSSGSPGYIIGCRLAKME